MSQQAWVELWRGNQCQAQARLTEGSVLRIGRALDNDFVAADRGVAPYHVNLALAGDALQVLWVMQTASGQITPARYRGAELDLNQAFTWTDDTQTDGSALSDPIELGGGWSLRWMSARAASTDAVIVRAQPMVVSAKPGLATPLTHAPGPETLPPVPLPKPASAPQDALDRLSVWKWLVVVFVLLGASHALEQWLGQSAADSSVGRWLPAALAMVGYLGLWSAGWMLVTKLFAQRTRFGLHLLIAASVLLLVFVADGVLSLAGFFLSWRGADQVGFYVVALLGFASLWAHLRAATLVGSTTLAVAVGSLMIGAGAFKLYWDSNISRDSGGSLYVKTLIPGVSPWRGTGDLDALMAQTKLLEAELREAASQPPPDGAAADMDDYESED
jgi:hypothetical protein